MVHLIKKQIIEIKLEKSLNYYMIQHNLSGQYWNEIIPVLERSFNKVSNDDEIFEIDLLELDLGIVNTEQLNDYVWIDEIKRKIEEQIEIITNPASPHYSIKSISRRLGIFQEWLYYMDHGFLPWNNKGINELWYQNVVETIAVDINSHKIVKQRVLFDNEFLERVVAQHDDRFLNTLIEVIIAKKQLYLPDFINELIAVSKYLITEGVGNESEKALRNHLWKNLLKWASSDRYVGTDELQLLLVKTFVWEKRISQDILDLIINRLSVTKSLLIKYTTELKDQLNKNDQNIEEFISQLNDKKNKKDLSDQIEQDKRSMNTTIIEEGIYVVNAGLVLLHPFLKTLFNRLELIKDGEFANKDSQLIAMHLLYYLSTSKIEPKEYELTIAKILCGYPLEDTVDSGDMTNAYMRDEAENLLRAVIDQWEILKNTTPDGLREGFLQRPGKLFLRNGNLYLQVEKNSIDILLDYLPWNLSIIALPWTKDILRVEWR